MLKSVGSEKIQSLDEKLARIIEMSGIKKTPIAENTNNGVSSSILHEATASNGDEYAIVQEEQYVYIKKKINEKFDYISGVENLKEFSYRDYANALKHLNLMFKDINESINHKENVDILKKKV